MARRWRFVLPVALAVAGCVAGWHYWPRLAAMALIVRVARHDGGLARVAQRFASQVSVDPVQPMPTRHGPVPSRRYRPAGVARRSILLVPGVHMDGIDEARLVGLARELAASGLGVITVAPPDLARYRIATESVDELEDAIAWAAAQPALAPDGKVGITAFSFAGGLALVAAGRPQVRDRVAFAFSFGGYADLERVLGYLCGQRATGATDAAGLPGVVVGGEHIHIPPPHDYGAVVALLNLADRMVPPDQVSGLQAAITLFLRASSLARTDPERAQVGFAEARRRGEELPEPARALMRQVSDRDVAKLGQALAPLLAGLDLPAALSPERSPAPAAPVFLLHGTDDSVVPASEMLALVRVLAPRTRVRAFASRLITHAEVDRGAALIEMWQLAGFWQDVLSR